MASSPFVALSMRPFWDISPRSVSVLSQKAGGENLIQMRATQELAQRVRELRLERFGERGGPLLAEILGVPEQTWTNYESGVTIPASVILHFVELTGANPRWLRTGEGDRYCDRRRGFDV